MRNKNNRVFKTLDAYLACANKETLKAIGLDYSLQSLQEISLQSIFKQFFSSKTQFFSNKVSLNFSHNQLTDEDIDAIAEAFKEGLGNYCSALHLRSTGITADQVERIWEALSAAPRMNKGFFLDLSANTIGDAGLDSLSQYLQKSWHHHMKLVLKNNGITQLGLAKLADTLISLKGSHLKLHCDLSHNEEIDDAYLMETAKQIEALAFPLGVTFSLDNDNTPEVLGTKLKSYAQDIKRAESLLACYLLFKAVQDDKSELYGVPTDVVFFITSILVPRVSPRAYSFFKEELRLDESKPGAPLHFKTL